MRFFNCIFRTFDSFASTSIMSHTFYILSLCMQLFMMCKRDVWIYIKRPHNFPLFMVVKNDENSGKLFSLFSSSGQSIESKFIKFTSIRVIPCQVAPWVSVDQFRF